jgi:hypothetical protein
MLFESVEHWVQDPTGKLMILMLDRIGGLGWFDSEWALHGELDQRGPLGLALRLSRRLVHPPTEAGFYSRGVD